MKRYVVTLQQREREEFAGITRKGFHPSQKVLNALILLNCDEGEFSERRAHGETIAEVLRISLRKVDRVKTRFVEEGLEAVLGVRQGRRPPMSARPTASSRRAWRPGRPRRGTRTHRQRVTRDCAPGSKKTRSSRGGVSAG